MGHASLEFSPLQLAVLTVSDTRDLASDSSGELLVTALKAAGHQLADRQLVKDDIYQIRAVLSQWIASPHIQGVIITGGTGFTGRDTTPEALLPIFERRLPGFEQAMMQASLAKTPTAAISRAVAGTLGRTIAITLPGSRKAVSENLAAILPALGHALEKLHGDPSDCGKRA